jgi:hypothetical protein
LLQNHEFSFIAFELWSTLLDTCIIFSVIAFDIAIFRSSLLNISPTRQSRSAPSKLTASEFGAIFLFGHLHNIFCHRFWHRYFSFIAFEHQSYATVAFGAFQAYSLWVWRHFSFVHRIWTTADYSFIAFEQRHFSVIAFDQLSIAFGYLINIRSSPLNTADYSFIDFEQRLPVHRLWTTLLQFIRLWEQQQQQQQQRNNNNINSNTATTTTTKHKATN